jgi:hypothetical protein
MQLALLPQTPIKQAKPCLGVEPVPVRIALGDRYFLTVTEGDRSWFFPLQFTELEARGLLPRIRGLDWSLDSRGVPVDIGEIERIVERLIDGGAL